MRCFAERSPFSAASAQPRSFTKSTERCSQHVPSGWRSTFHQGGAASSTRVEGHLPAGWKAVFQQGGRLSSSRVEHHLPAGWRRMFHPECGKGRQRCGIRDSTPRRSVTSGYENPTLQDAVRSIFARAFSPWRLLLIRIIFNRVRQIEIHPSRIIKKGTNLAACPFHHYIKMGF
jgi:uncharacterized protein YbdZ (MbtH family)